MPARRFNRRPVPVLPRTRLAAYEDNPLRAQEHATRAMTYALIGLFIFAPVFGILAVGEVAHARTYGATKVPAETLAWIDIVWGGLFFLAVVVLAMFPQGIPYLQSLYYGNQLAHVMNGFQ